MRERNARERVLMERFTRTRIVASLAEGLQAMRSEASGLGASQSEDFGWMAKAAAWVRRGSRRVQPEGADGMAAPVRLLANPWLWFRSRVLLIFRDPAFENTFRVYHNHHHALSIFRIETAFIAVTTAIHAVLDYTTYHEFLISELDFKMWLAVTAIVCIAGFFASFSSAVRRRPVVFQSICWFANMAILQVVLVLYTTNRHMHDRNVYAPIAVEIILAAAGESGMRVAWFLSFAAVVLLASISKVAAGAAGMRELLDVGFPCLVGIVYGILAEGEIRRWYVVRQRAVGLNCDSAGLVACLCFMWSQLLKVPGINRYNGKIGSSWEEV